ncbi:MAG: hypothetical protein KY459_01595 [Acidobacteria bacterium]|nr:hypothetical protein [Acidobacteriota bacterium]
MSRCPWCAEKVPRGEGLCPTCGRAVIDDHGRPLRRLDLVYEETVAWQKRTANELLLWGSIAFAVASLAVPLTNVAAPVAAAFLLVTQMVVLRLVLARRAMLLLSARRRMFVRWITRLGLIVAGTVGYGATLAPIVGAGAGGLTFALLTFATHRYILRSLRKEKEREPPELWEKLVLLLLALILTFILISLLAMGYAIGWFTHSMTNIG